MSEKMSETPKYKRRTKEEIEAAKAAGTYKPRTTKKAQQAPLSPEQSVMIMACLQPEVSKKAIAAAKERGVEVVILEDRVIHDYLNSKNKEGDKQKSLSDFLNDTSNRLHAENQCVNLWMILTGGRPIEDASNQVFTRTEVVKKTNLSHGKADQILQLLRVFGMVKFTKGTHEFAFNFSKSKCHDTIETEVLSMGMVLRNDILRFKASINSDDTLSKEQKDERLKNLVQRIINEVSKD